MGIRFDKAVNYSALIQQKTRIRQTNLTGLFGSNANRAKEQSIKTPHFCYDYSRQLVDQQVLGHLFDLAKEVDLKGKMEAMYAGKEINVTEGRAVGHVRLRAASPEPEVKAVLDHVKQFSEEIISGQRTGVTGKRIKNIVSIGIGGSYLGPEYLAIACRAYAKEGMNLVFVANVDGTDFIEKTKGLNPEETLVLVVSKTFTTAETMKNAETAKYWMTGRLGNKPEVIAKHFAAVSTAEEKVKAFGIDPANMFGFWDWVGGRYSATSAVGALPLSLYLGYDNFSKILEGANWLDRHFIETPFENNLPVVSALLDIWNINILGYKTRALLPYFQALAKLPAHTQQVEMESNGKMVGIDGQPVTYDTGEVVFGEPGTNGQHSFYQLIHQGTQVIPCDFIGFIKPQYAVGAATAKEVSHHQELMTNFLAQPDALAFGKADQYLPKNFPGNRPSSSLLLKELNPFTAGLLLAWTEHRAAAKGFMWDINSFDQFGVELGKVLGVDQRKRMLEFNATKKINTEGLNSSTATLLTSFLTDQLPS